MSEPAKTCSTCEHWKPMKLPRSKSCWGVCDKESEYYGPDSVRTMGIYTCEYWAPFKEPTPGDEPKP